MPDLTLLFDVEPDVGLARARSRDAREGRFEAEELAFHERVRSAFHEIARREPSRVAVVDAGEDVDRVAERAWHAVARRFELT